MTESIAPIFHQLFHGSFDLLLVIYLIAITTEAMSGALAAGRRNMDIFGVVVIAFVTALGAAPSAMWCWATTPWAGHSIPNTPTWSFWLA